MGNGDMPPSSFFDFFSSKTVGTQKIQTIMHVIINRIDNIDN
jgi:hypothetical protein